MHSVRLGASRPAGRPRRVRPGAECLRAPHRGGLVHGGRRDARDWALAGPGRTGCSAPGLCLSRSSSAGGTSGAGTWSWAHLRAIGGGPGPGINGSPNRQPTRTTRGDRRPGCELGGGARADGELMAQGEYLWLEATRARKPARREAKEDSLHGQAQATHRSSSDLKSLAATPPRRGIRDPGSFGILGTDRVSLCRQIV